MITACELHSNWKEFKVFNVFYFPPVNVNVAQANGFDVDADLDAALHIGAGPTPNPANFALVANNVTTQTVESKAVE